MWVYKWECGSRIVGRSTVYSSNFIILTIVCYQFDYPAGMLNQHSQDFHRNSAFRKLEAPETDFATVDPAHLGVTSEMMQVINAQNLLIMKLLERQNALYKELNKKFSSSDSGSNQAHKQNNPAKVSGYREFNNLEQFSSSSNRSGAPIQAHNPVKIIQKPSAPSAHAKQLKKVDFRCEISSSPEQGGEQSNPKEDKNCERRRQTETKNMVKNFAKAIFSYIRKNREKRLLVLGRLGVGEEEFMRVFDQFKGHIHSISELRSLWTAEGNPFHQAFRVLSCEYLRKHCLERTFNSRVENYSIHLKYRQRLFDGLKNPEDFTALKTN